MIDDSDLEDRRKFRDRRIPAKLLPVLAQLKVRTIPEPYCMVALAPGETQAAQKFLASQKMPFSSLSADDREVSFVVPEGIWRKSADRFGEARVEKGYRVLALEGEADWNTPGFMAVIGRVLAEGGIGAGVVSGSRRLHLLVKAVEAKDARIFLDLLANQARGRVGTLGRG